MAVKRIVANIAAAQTDAARSFYGDVLGMSVVMDMKWIVTFAADCQRGTADQRGDRGWLGNSRTGPLYRGG